MKNPHDIILRPVLTEASYDGIANKDYTFEVALKANKTEIKQAIETIFGVKVERVNTARQIGKVKRMGLHSAAARKSRRLTSSSRNPLSPSSSSRAWPSKLSFSRREFKDGYQVL